MITVATSGYFNPLTPGHLSCFRDIKSLWDELVVIVNNDAQQLLKRNWEFMPLEDRMEVVLELGCVDRVVASIDTDALVCETLRMIKPDIFAKGGEWTDENMPQEMVETCREIGCMIVCGLGENPTIHSSSNYFKKFLSYYENGDCD